MGCYRRLFCDAFRKTTPVESFSSRCDPRTVLRNVFNNNQKKISPFFDGAAKRFYNADRNRVHRRRYQNRRILYFSCVSGVVISVYYWNLETVPYTKRRHFVLLSTSLEKKLGELELSEYYEGKILASDHPDSIRVEKIGRDMIGGLLKRLNKMEDDEQTAHLEEFNWEFLVVDGPIPAHAAPGGKIVVSTTVLNYFKTDAEIATIIGHKVGHAVARHRAEIISGSHIYHVLSSSLGRLYYRMHEMEADYIGLLASASAGYDPRKMLEFYRRSGSCPHRKERFQLLSQPKVMDEALAIYREALNEKDKENEKEFMDKALAIYREALIEKEKEKEFMDKALAMYREALKKKKKEEEGSSGPPQLF